MPEKRTEAQIKEAKLAAKVAAANPNPEGVVIHKQHSRSNPVTDGSAR